MTPTIEILSTGNEVLNGDITDTNSAYIAQKLKDVGLKTFRHHVIGDSKDQLVAIFNEIGHRSDICIVTGGLGPTMDDLSREAAACASEQKLIISQAALESIQKFFIQFKKPMPESNQKQALLPQEAVIIENPVGTAPGFYMTIKTCLFFFIPGVPHEMRHLLKTKVIPEIKKTLGNSKSFFLTKNISTFGLPESGVNDKLNNIIDKLSGVDLGLRAKFPEIHIKLYAAHEKEDSALNNLAAAEKIIQQEFGTFVLSNDGRSLAQVIADQLTKDKETLSIAESCTGGYIANVLTDIPGSSDFFVGSATTYANSLKSSLLKIESALIEKYGAVSEEVVQQMARQIRLLTGSTYGLATSGIAGPTGGSEKKPVGTICIGLSFDEELTSRLMVLNFGDRIRNKKIFAYAALEMLRQYLIVKN